MPVVGDFAGAKAVRAVGAYLKRTTRSCRRSTCRTSSSISGWSASGGSFCGNAARLPIDETSTFIRAGRGGRYSRGTALTAELASIAVEVEGCDRRP